MHDVAGASTAAKANRGRMLANKAYTKIPGCYNQALGSFSRLTVRRPLARASGAIAFSRA
jgi:hypothetical protein